MSAVPTNETMLPAAQDPDDIKARCLSASSVEESNGIMCIENSNAIWSICRWYHHGTEEGSDLMGFCILNKTRTPPGVVHVLSSPLYIARCRPSLVQSDKQILAALSTKLTARSKDSGSTHCGDTSTNFSLYWS